jgi:hypothetical protein
MSEGGSDNNQSSVPKHHSRHEIATRKRHVLYIWVCFSQNNTYASAAVYALETHRDLGAKKSYDELGEVAYCLSCK